jgi:putative hydrolase of the HAD superfamily
MGVKALMVDVDGVIVTHPHPDGWAVNLERDLGLPKQRLQDHFFRPHFGDITLGRAALRERLSPVLLEIAPHLTCDQLIRYWFEQDSHVDHDLLEQLTRVRSGGVEVHLATVQEHERAHYLWHDLRLREHFDGMHYAAALGWAKPSAEFYAAVESRAGFKGFEISFIDDKPSNVDAARRCGWTAALWRRGERLDELLPELARLMR